MNCNYPWTWLGLLVALLLTGCAQNTPADMAQPTRQIQAPVTDQAAQGSKSDVTVYIVNAPGGNELPATAAGVVLDLSDANNPGGVKEASSAEAGNSAKDTRAGYVQQGFTLNIHTGGSSTGPQGTGALGGQQATPSATITQHPEQKPEATLSGSLAFGMPGSAPQATSTTNSGAGTATTNADQVAELRTMLAQTLQKSYENTCQLAELATKFFGLPVLPATPPPAPPPPPPPATQPGP